MLTIAKFRILPSFIGRVAHRINRNGKIVRQFLPGEMAEKILAGRVPNGFPSALLTSYQSDLLGADDEQCAQAGVNALGAQ
jgi:hypothetical protein